MPDQEAHRKREDLQEHDGHEEISNGQRNPLAEVGRVQSGMKLAVGANVNDATTASKHLEGRAA